MGTKDFFVTFFKSIHFIVVIFFIFFFLFFVIVHEKVHSMIFDYYNCTDISYGFDGDVYTDADCSQITNEANRDVEFLQSLTEIIHYPIFVLIGVIFFVIISLLPNKKQEKQEQPPVS